MLINYKSANKYAIAYTNLYISELNDNSVQVLLSLATFLKHNSSFCAYLSIPSLDLASKQSFIKKLCEIFKLTQNQCTLINLLIKNKKIDLLASVLQRIVVHYNNRRGVTKVSVLTSHVVSEDQKIMITRFIANKLKLKATIDFMLSKKLICGIRIKSENVLWEKSIVKYLAALEKNNILQVTS